MALALAMLACTTAEPPGTAAERERLAQAGTTFVEPFERRQLPDLPESPSIEAVLERAFRANPDVERSYFYWAMAASRIAQVTALPDPRVSYELLFSRERVRSWDRTTLELGQLVVLPRRRRREGEIALAQAIAAGRRLEDAKFGLQARVIETWQELWLLDRRIEIDAENLALLREFSAVARQLVAVGRASQVEASKADLEQAAAENRLVTRRSERAAVVARINALLSRPPDAPIRASAPAHSQGLQLTDDAILRLAAERNPELAALAADVQGSESALELARLAYLPDLDLRIGLQGSMERMVESMVALPLQVGRIRAAIDEAQAGLRAAEAELRARRNEVGAEVVLELFLARDSERQLGVYREELIPRARDVTRTLEDTYATGSASFLDLLDAQRSLLAFEEGAVELQATQGKAIAALEALCALDFGAAADPGSRP